MTHMTHKKMAKTLEFVDTFACTMVQDAGTLTPQAVLVKYTEENEDHTIVMSQQWGKPDDKASFDKAVMGAVLSSKPDMVIVMLEAWLRSGPSRESDRVGEAIVLIVEWPGHQKVLMRDIKRSEDGGLIEVCEPRQVHQMKGWDAQWTGYFRKTRDANAAPSFEGPLH